MQGLMGGDYQHPEEGFMCLSRAQTECTQPILIQKVSQINLKGQIVTQFQSDIQFDCPSFLFEVKKMLCLFNYPIQHSQAAPVIKTDNGPNSAFSLSFQLKPAAWFHLKPAVGSRGDGGLLHCVFFCSAILYFLSAWALILLVRIYVEKAFIPPPLLSAMFEYKKAFMMTSLSKLSHPGRRV